IIRAYDTLLPIHRYPIAVIAIELDPILVDVNVHPTKLEVRFSKEKELIQMLEGMIRQALRSSSLIPKMEQKPKQKLKTEQDTFQFGTFLAPDKAPLESTKPLEVDWSKQVEEASSKDFPINTERKQEKPAPVTNTYHDEAI